MRCQLVVEFVDGDGDGDAVADVAAVDDAAEVVADEVAAVRGLLVRPSLRPYYWVCLNSNLLM